MSANAAALEALFPNFCLVMNFLTVFGPPTPFVVVGGRCRLRWVNGHILYKFFFIYKYKIMVNKNNT
jgi:hypothetical protein